jgi:hypothetical protein
MVDGLKTFWQVYSIKNVRTILGKVHTYVRVCVSCYTYVELRWFIIGHALIMIIEKG